MKYSKEQMEQVFKNGALYHNNRNDSYDFFKGNFTHEDFDKCNYKDIQVFNIKKRTEEDIRNAAYKAAEYILDKGIVDYCVYGSLYSPAVIMVYYK